jgi:predicted deacetylase
MISSLTPAIISVHDVMPSTLGKVVNILETTLSDVPKEHVLLLVVPGLVWSPEQIVQLKALQNRGYELAGHGWHHGVKEIKTVWHRLHSVFLSRRAAEHLSLNVGELEQLLTNNYQWFKTHDFKLPKFYVPPAWAMGCISREALKRLPFYCYEYTTGCFDSGSGEFRVLPLVGFEADTRLRAWFLRIWNRINLQQAKALRPLRISIHPYDLDYRLSGQLRHIVNHCESVHWSSIFHGNSTEVTINSENPDETRIC